MISILHRKKVSLYLIITLTLFTLSFGKQVFASVLSPGTIYSCGEITVTGTYTLSSTSTFSAGLGNDCFTITSGGTSNQTIIDGNGKTVVGNVNGNGVNSGNPGHSFTLRNATVVGTTSANGAITSSFLGGNGGSIVVSSSTVGAVTSNGGLGGIYSGSGGSISISSSTVNVVEAVAGSGGSAGDGNGGSITITKAGLDLSNANILAGGTSNGTLTLNFNTLTHNNLYLSALSDVILNGPSSLPGDVGSFIGGILVAVPGETITNISQCNFGLSGTYTLGIDLTGNCRITTNGVVINFATHKINGTIDGDGINPTDPGFNFTLATTTIVGTTTSRGSTGGSITISGSNIDLSNSYIDLSSYTSTSSDGTLTLNYNTLNYSGLILSHLSNITTNHLGNLGSFGGGIFGTFPGDTISNISQCNIGLPGTYTFVHNTYTGNCRITTSGVTIQGASSTIVGNVDGDGYDPGDWGSSFVLNNLNVTGTTSAKGADSIVDGGNGGTITISKPSIILADEHISVLRGIGSSTNGISGSLILNYTSLDHTNTVLPALTDLILNGPGNVPGDLGSFGGGGFLSASSTISSASNCNIIDPGTYTLTTNITGNCYVRSNGVTIDGGGNSFNGVIYTDGPVSTDPSYDLTLKNIIFSGVVSATSYSNNGGNITILNSTTTSAQIWFGVGGIGGSLSITGINSLSGINIFGPAGGAGPNVTITGTDIDLSGADINLTGSPNGTLTINYNTLNYTGLTISALSDLVLNRPNNFPGNIGVFGGGTLGALPGDTINDVSQCLLFVPGTYKLGQDITGNCSIGSNGVILNGQNHRLNGGVHGDGSLTSSGYNFTLENITVTGTTSSNGAVITSFLQNVGNGGNITILNSTVATTTSNGGISGAGSYWALGGNGGIISILNSTSTYVEVSGGGVTYNDIINVISPENLRLTIINDNYGASAPNSYGGNGGTITISTSTTGQLISNGGSTLFGNAGKGGNINVTNSVSHPLSSDVIANGGSSALCGYGGSGGSVFLVNSSYGSSIYNKGTDAILTVSNGGFCSDPRSSQTFVPLSGSSGSSGYAQILGVYTPSAVTSPAINQVPAVVEVPHQVIPSSGGSSVSSNIPVETNNFVQTIASYFTPGSFASAAKAAVQKVTETANTFVNSPASKTVQATGFFAGLVASVAFYTDTAFATPIAASEAVLIPARLWGLILMGLGIRRKSRPWGTVYDSVTKQPIDPAHIIARDSSGRIVAEAITDIDGRYGFLLPDGTYYISVEKTNYEFPSKKLEGKQGDELYNDLYFGEPVTVRSGEVLDKNIPLDQKNFDWNEQNKAQVDSQNAPSFHTRHEKPFAIASNYIYGIGLIISAVAVSLNPSTFNITILISYTLILLFLRFSVRTKKLGIIRDKNNHPLSYAIIHVTTPDRSVILRSCVSDLQGRYYCIVPKGEYALDIQKKNTDGSYTKVYESSVGMNSTGIVNVDFVI